MKLKRMMIICLAAILVMVPVGTSLMASGAADVKSKDEVVYATLSPVGAVDAIYTVNHFTVTKNGSITDYGMYDSVVNLTNTDPLTQEKDAVSFTANEANYYYQGNMTTTDLPWIFDVSYYLDGAKTAPQDIAGKAGAVEIRISSRQNSNVDATFYENYMLQITATLDTETCSGINAPGGTLANAGKNKIIAYTVLPGKDADFTLTTDACDFSITGIDITAMPFSMEVEMPDMEGKLGDLEKLPDAISELNDGVGELLSGTKDMRNGARTLQEGSSGIQSGLAQLNANAGSLTTASAQISTALSQIAASLSGGSTIDLTQISQLPAGLAQLSTGLKEMSGGLTQLKNGFVPAYSALDTAIQGIPAATDLQALIQELYGLAATSSRPDLSGALDQLTAAYTAAQTVKGTYSQVKVAFDAVGSTIDAMTGALNTMADSLTTTSGEISTALQGLGGLEQIGKLAAGLTELSSSYSSFHAGLTSYMSGVNTLTSNYNTFHAGIVSLGDGVGKLSSGVNELHDGTGTLNEEIADMPEMMQTEIDKMKEQYMPVDFDPVSFTSPKNTNTEFVQFVLKCEGIEKPDEPAAAPPEEKDETFWDRLLALFKKEK